MKFNCGPTPHERKLAKIKKLENWHDIFCWWPVRLGSNDCRWLETVQRRYSEVNYYSGYRYGKEFREKP